MKENRYARSREHYACRGTWSAGTCAAQGSLCRGNQMAPLYSRDRRRTGMRQPRPRPPVIRLRQAANRRSWQRGSGHLRLVVHGHGQGLETHQKTGVLEWPAGKPADDLHPRREHRGDIAEELVIRNLVSRRPIGRIICGRSTSYPGPWHGD